ncbi:MAG: hypothetical protein RMJ03_03895 [Nitrososphaerota archaeon]|nr:hypothetical protein [Candidatus Bathyarchaeota archaeon]MDW8040549.1 hypothetical protein [Nitrososphaerota archaeon]
MEEFNKLLMRVIDETLRYSLGDRTMEIFYEYLRRKGFTPSKIPQDPDTFFEELRKVLEFEDSGMRFRRVSGIGLVSILERAIIEVLCKQLDLEFDEKGPIVFSEWVEKVREAYTAKHSNLKLSLPQTEVKTVHGKGKHPNSGR